MTFPNPPSLCGLESNSNLTRVAVLTRADEDFGIANSNNRKPDHYQLKVINGAEGETRTPLFFSTVFIGFYSV